MIYENNYCQDNINAKDYKLIDFDVIIDLSLINIELNQIYFFINNKETMNLQTNIGSNNLKKKDD